MAYQMHAGRVALESVFSPAPVDYKQPAAKGRSTGAVKPILGFIFILGILIFCIFFHTWQRVEILRLGYAIEKLEAQKSEAILQNKQLRIELAALKSPAHLERMAQMRLGMVRPKAGQVVFLAPKNGQ